MVFQNCILYSTHSLSTQTEKRTKVMERICTNFTTLFIYGLLQNRLMLKSSVFERLVVWNHSYMSKSRAFEMGTILYLFSFPPPPLHQHSSDPWQAQLFRLSRKLSQQKRANNALPVSEQEHLTTNVCIKTHEGKTRDLVPCDQKLEQQQLNHPCQRQHAVWSVSLLCLSTA